MSWRSSGHSDICDSVIVNKVTVLGNKDHGKSTLIGSLLIETGSVSEQRIDDAKRTSKKLGRRFEPGYILDSFEEERLNEMTIDTTRAQVKYKRTGFEFIDVPGHEELIKNMLSGASYADFALLLVSAKQGEGITSQTKRHLFVAKMLGIRKLVVAVNKLDAVGYRQEVFEDVSEGIGRYLASIGFPGENVRFVPISAYNGENLVRPSEKMKWYRGRCLIEVLEGMARPSAHVVGKSLLIQVQGVSEDSRKTVFGKVVSGLLARGTIITMFPSKKRATVIGLFVSGRSRKTAERGDVVTLELDSPVAPNIKGSVASDSDAACISSDKINALLLNTTGFSKDASIRINGVQVKCRNVSVKDEIDVSTGECVPSERIRPLNAGHVELLLERKVAADLFERTPEIGRFVFYSGKEFSGIGIVTGGGNG